MEYYLTAGITTSHKSKTALGAKRQLGDFLQWTRCNIIRLKNTDGNILETYIHDSDCTFAKKTGYHKGWNKT